MDKRQHGRHFVSYAYAEIPVKDLLGHNIIRSTFVSNQIGNVSNQIGNVSNQIGNVFNQIGNVSNRKHV